MDYKELIDAMRGDSIGLIVARAHDSADALETLLAERDAAVEDLRGQCGKCKLTGGMSDYWQWHGPQGEKIGG